MYRSLKYMNAIILASVAYLAPLAASPPTNPAYVNHYNNQYFNDQGAPVYQDSYNSQYNSTLYPNNVPSPYGSSYSNSNYAPQYNGYTNRYQNPIDYSYLESPPPPTPAQAFPDEARANALYQQILNR